jgi:hypothetical protein
MGKGEMHTGRLLGKLRKRDSLEDLGVDGRIILQWIFKKDNGDVEWFHVAQDRGKQLALVKAVIKLRVP